MGIRYGRIPSGSKEVEWQFVSHCECDGIGGFARVLRKSGVRLNSLPNTRNSNREIFGPLWRLWRRNKSECADRRDWTPNGPSGENLVAWHLFSEDETKALREKCRSEKISVNSFLLKLLDQAIRPDIRKPEATIPWMIPVNLRGDINHADDTENHVSYIEARISANDSPTEIQNQIHSRLKRGEHRAFYLLLALGRFLSHRAKVNLITRDRTKPAGNIGAFSNLGVWDPDKTIETSDFWLFCPPVVKGQLLGAGCVTFQGRLGLTIQSHSSLQNSPEIPKIWLNRILSSI